MNSAYNFLGIATTKEIEKVKTEMREDIKGIKTEMREDIKGITTEMREDVCTMIVNGIHICDHERYPNTIHDPESITPSQILSVQENFCIKFDHLPDITGAPLNDQVGHGDIPNNYICFEKGKLDQYVQATVPAQTYNSFMNSPMKHIPLKSMYMTFAAQQSYPYDRRSPSRARNTYPNGHFSPPPPPSSESNYPNRSLSRMVEPSSAESSAELRTQLNNMPQSRGRMRRVDHMVEEELV
tara:strand:- start:50 stop:769 length:720 start_codon:yes stop_codon:yes gene_type:complete